MGCIFRHRITVAFLAVLLGTSCATRVENDRDAKDLSAANRELVFQNPALTPRNGGRAVSVEALQDGDIVLTAAKGIASAGIRLLTLAPVSHAAIYLGNREVAEAVGEGIRIRSLEDVLTEEAVVVAFRHPQLTSNQAQLIRDFANQTIGRRYNHIGVMLHAPFSLERRVCELPLLPEAVRDFCIRGIARIQLGASSNDRFFCSQFVLEAYRRAGVPITDADSRWISPADILHMREGDVPSVKIHQPLLYVGHLKYQPASLDMERTANAR